MWIHWGQIKLRPTVDGHAGDHPSISKHVFCKQHIPNTAGANNSRFHEGITTINFVYKYYLTVYLELSHTEFRAWGFWVGVWGLGFCGWVWVGVFSAAKTQQTLSILSLIVKMQHLSCGIIWIWSTQYLKSECLWLVRPWLWVVKVSQEFLIKDKNTCVLGAKIQQTIRCVFIVGPFVTVNSKAFHRTVVRGWKSFYPNLVDGAVARWTFFINFLSKLHAIRK